MGREPWVEWTVWPPSTPKEKRKKPSMGWPHPGKRKFQAGGAHAASNAIPLLGPKQAAAIRASPGPLHGWVNWGPRQTVPVSGSLLAEGSRLDTFSHTF